MQGAEVLAFLEEGDGVGLRFGGQAREELRVDDDAFQVGERGCKGGEEACWVAEAEELEGQGFDGGGERRGDVVGFGEEVLVVGEFDVGGEG